jgi:hypothetical protein
MYSGRWLLPSGLKRRCFPEQVMEIFHQHPDGNQEDFLKDSLWLGSPLPVSFGKGYVAVPSVHCTRTPVIVSFVPFAFLSCSRADAFFRSFGSHWPVETSFFLPCLWLWLQILSSMIQLFSLLHNHPFCQFGSFIPWSWRQCVLLKCWYPPSGLNYVRMWTTTIWMLCKPQVFKDTRESQYIGHNWI